MNLQDNQVNTDDKKDVEPFGVPIVFEYSATHYCRYCHTWGTTDNDELCGNCGQTGFMIKNPFPDNMVPYYVAPKPNTNTKLGLGLVMNTDDKKGRNMK